MADEQGEGSLDAYPLGDKRISSGLTHFSIRIGPFGSGRGHQNYKGCSVGWGVNLTGRRIYCPTRRHASPDGGGTVPNAKFWRAPRLPPEISRGAQANVSRRPFPCARQRFLSVLEVL
jgi:hypothetical protein